MWMTALPAVVVLFGAWTGLAAGLTIFWAGTAAAWLLSPMIALIISTSLRHGPKLKKSSGQIDALRLTARRTWCYFADNSTIENHWLCPDNLQIQPGPKLSAKTSPTNIGLQLLSLLSARDLGYIGLYRLIRSCEVVVDTLMSLPKWHGHLYNWYNVRTLQVLSPRYVSLVDSGNFVAHLIALKNGLLDQQSADLLASASIIGLADTCRLAGWSDKLDLTPPLTAADWAGRLEALQQAGLSGDAETERWQGRVQDMCLEWLEDMRRLNIAGAIDKQKNLQELALGDHPEANKLIKRIDDLVSNIDDLINNTDYRVLYDKKFGLFSIGYNVAAQTADSGHYDLLASEARVASFLAIAKGDIPQKHWFVLGRPLTLVRGIPACVSWSGSMFEYLMPSLIMKTPAGSVLQQSCLAAVIQQIAYARKHKIPWGISESQYYRFDTDSNYQYGPFGVQRLRLQASMTPARVVAPYATMLALSVQPQKALENLSRLRALGAEGENGFYEALDFHQPNATSLQPFSLVSSFMAHHQGMSLVAINNFLNKAVMQRRFHREPMVQATESLLDEKRSGSIVTLASRGYTINVKVSDLADDVIESRSCRQTNLIHPLVHVLSNNHYRVMLTSDGAGFSSCDDWVINRWRPEIINNQDGQFIYIRNLTSKQCWSAAYLPTQAEADEYQAVFSHDKAEIIRRDGPVQTHTTIAVSPVNNLEVRRVTLTNQGSQALIIELTSYLEVVADGQLADALHPAFSKLFLETEYLADRHLLIVNRRQRSPDDQPRYIMHTLLSGQKLLRPVEFEIDRRQFIGRGGSLARPHILDSGATLSGKAGFSTDTILSLRAVVSIPAGKSASVSFVTGFAASRADILKLSYELGKPFSAEDIFKLSSSSCKLEMKYLGISSKQINAIQNLVHCLFYPEAAVYGAPEAIGRMKMGQNGLWRFGISGDHPIILLVVSQLNEMPVIKEIVTVYEYLRIKQVKADLVILNEEPSGYAQLLNHRIREMTGNLKIFSRNQPKPSLFLLQKANLSHEEHDLLMGVARLILTGRTGLYAPLGKLQQQDKPPDTKSAAIPLPAGYHPREANLVQSPVFDGSNLEYYNGIGGFAKDGRVYEIHLQNGLKTPMPWINVIANELFGFQVSETGSGFTWAGNSRENKLTTWHNDPILDPVSEAIYIRDDETGGITSPAALIPEHQGGHYRIEHGFGYSVFSHSELDLDQSMIVFVPPADPVRLWQLSLTNTAEKTRSVTIVLYVEWVLGVIKDQTAPYIQTAFDPNANLLTAINRFQDAAHQHPAFIFSSEPIQAFTGDRKAFFGIGGSIRYPSGLVKDSLSNQIGVGLDPCGVIQVHVQLEPNQTKVAIFGLGQEDTLEKAIELADKYRHVRAAAEALDRIHEYWAETLGSVTIRTPDRALDLLFNGWLQYQVISCRLRARAAYYQCGGAMGFRDQLQDVLALLDADPARAREQILLCCSRQFVEGDVQHWWHPSSGLGVRTRISDDMLWIPYVTAAYIQHTGDSSILDCDVPFITGKQLDDDQAEMMILPQVSASSASVYQHCLRAIDRASQMGAQGLPLMGGGDWNDGMNRVGIGGRGESVWLGFFLYAVLQRFLPFIQQQGDLHISQQMTDLSDALLDSIERHAWDGEWYLRAFFDDGAPLGSKISDECRIDSISQSWAVLSEGAGRIRALTALDSARRFLVREEDGISLLLAPPFDKPSHNPGYIQGYPPGIRENGGQYTHAAVWLAMAFAQVGNGHMAGQLLTMLNPIHATSTLQSANKYEKEPYVMAGDISMGGAYNGKAGWSWYTGSAGWMYQAILQKYLGISKIGDHLMIRPAVPASFKRYVVEYRYHSALYEITIFNEPQQQGQDPTLLVDNLTIAGNRFQLIDDGAVHRVEFRMPLR
jgi:cellobiose phosphorylase